MLRQTRVASLLQTWSLVLQPPASPSLGLDTMVTACRPQFDLLRAGEQACEVGNLKATVWLGHQGRCPSLTSTPVAGVLLTACTSAERHCWLIFDRHRPTPLEDNKKDRFNLIAFILSSDKRKMPNLRRYSALWQLPHHRRRNVFNV